ncbi:MAG: hypothetical protein QM820_01210 [Minicystis sp.]
MRRWIRTLADRLWPTPALRARAQRLAVAPALLALLGAIHSWTTEDAFIDFRVVQHLLAGHGPIFNLGERVEAYTNPLWVAILAILAAPLRPLLGERVPIEWMALLLGLGCTVAGLVLAELGALRLARASGRAGQPLPLGALALAALPPVWSFATSGLETGLVMGWLGLCFWGSVRYPRAGRRWLPVVAGLGPLIRPDLAVHSAGFLAVLLLLTRGGIGARIRLLAAAAALPVAYQIFRMGYFASVVPSTAVAKEASLAWWSQGWFYLTDFVVPYGLWFPLAIAALAAAAAVRRALARHGRRRTRLLALTLGPMIAGLLHATYVTRVGGDFMHGRLLLPAWFAILAPVAVVMETRARRRLPRAAPTVAMAAWAIVCAAVLRVPYRGGEKDGIGPHGIADERYYYAGRNGFVTPVSLAHYSLGDWAKEGFRLRELAETRRVLIVPRGGNKHGSAPQDTTIEMDLAPGVAANVVSARAHVGIFGYAAGLRVSPLDRLGLGDAVAAHVALARRGRPGHEKWLDLSWAVARFARDPGRNFGPEAPPVAKVLDARAALRCGELAELVEAVSAPLTLERFTHNVRIAWRLTQFRFPADPTAARAALCGPARRERMHPVE